MTTLELMLRDAGAHVEWPATPAIADAVAGRIAAAADAAESAPVRMRLPRLRRPLAIALASLLVLSAGAAAIPGIREPILDFLGLRSVKIERVPRPLPVVPGSKLGLGTHTTLASARERVAFTAVRLAGLGEPVVYYDSVVPGGQIALVYRKGSLLLNQLQGQLRREFLFKFVPPGSKLDQVTVNGERGIWIHGAPHQYAYADKTGDIKLDNVRLAGDVLLWRHGDLLLRLEGAASKAEALRLARAAR
jgi:hypothetical protein